MNEVQDIDRDIEEAVERLSSKSPKPPRRVKGRALLEKKTAIPALKQSFAHAGPDIQWKIR